MVDRNAALPWEEVVNRPEYRSLGPRARQLVKQQYFEDVISAKVPEHDRGLAMEQFMTAADPVREQRVIGKEGMPAAIQKTIEEDKSPLGGPLAAFGSGATRFGRAAAGVFGPSAEKSDRAELDEQLQQKYPMSAFTGDVATMAPVAMLPGANTVLGAAGYAGGAGFLGTPGSLEERGKAAALAAPTGGLGVAAARAVPALWGAIADPLSAGGRERMALRTLGQFSKDPQAAYRVSPQAARDAELIPGSKPTLAEVTDDPGIAVLERTAQTDPNVSAAFAERKTARIQARQDALRTIAGQPGEAGRLEAARDRAAQTDYKRAFDAGIDPAKVSPAVRKEMDALLKRPSVIKAVAEAKNLAAEAGVDIGEQAEGSVQGLHYVKKALDDQISEAMQSGNSNRARLLKETQGELLKVVDEMSPAYKTARANFAKASKPIARLEVGEYLRTKLFPALTDLGAERTTPTKYAEVLRQGDEIAKRATGFPGAKLDDILTTDDLKLVANMGREVGREARVAERGAVKGSPTAQYQLGANMIKQIVDPMGLPGPIKNWILRELAAAPASWLSSAGKPIEAKIQARIGELLLHPEQAAGAAGRAASREQKLLPLSEFMRVTGPTAAIGAGSAAAESK
ncbi:MAG TPA: hypothetical protein VGM15_03200 [Burkholderiaceae bacterium]